MEEELIEQCRKNERKAQYALYKRWFSALMRMAARYKRNRNDAAALVNEAFFKIFTNIEKYDSRIPFEAWIRKIMLNTIIDEYRREKIHRENVTEVGENEEIIFTDTELNLIEKEMSSEEAERILFSLDEHERTVFNMFEMEGYTHKEIGETLGISERTSKRYLAGAKKNLQETLKGILNTVLIFI